MNALYSTRLYKMPCVHRTPMLLLPLLYECSVTIVLLSGANERRHYPLEHSNSGKKVSIRFDSILAIESIFFDSIRQSDTFAACTLIFK